MYTTKVHSSRKNIQHHKSKTLKATNLTIVKPYKYPRPKQNGPPFFF